MEINERWKEVKRGTSFEYVVRDRSFTCFVAAIDPEIGLTCEFLDQDEARDVGFTPDPKSGRHNSICLPKDQWVKEYSLDSYVMRFNKYVLAILSGKFNHTIGGINMSTCAF